MSEDNPIWPKKEFICSVKTAIRRLHEDHGKLVYMGVREEAITFYFAAYLYQELEIRERKDIDLDVEYNKEQDGTKDFILENHPNIRVMWKNNYPNLTVILIES